MLRQGEGDPLVLFHGILGSGALWKRVAPLLTGEFEVIVPTALGHRGGPLPLRSPTTIIDVIDDAERQLEEAGIERPHLAGNSMGGWISLELARRGKARSVCAISPAGLWGEPGKATKPTTANGTGPSTCCSALARKPAAAATWRPSSATRSWFGGGRSPISPSTASACTRQEFVDITEDTYGCDVAEDMIGSPGYSIEPLDASCPVTIAWAEKDRLFPLDVYRERAEHIVPAARFLVLEGVGHVPMLDDPELIASTIREATSLASPSAA